MCVYLQIQMSSNVTLLRIVNVNPLFNITLMYVYIQMVLPTPTFHRKLCGISYVNVSIITFGRIFQKFCEIWNDRVEYIKSAVAEA